MGSIRELKKKNGETTYHAEVRLKGKKTERETFRTKTQAKQWIQDTEAAIRDGRYKSNSGSKKHTVGDLIDRFISHYIPEHPRYYKQKVQLLQRWKDELGKVYLSDLSSSHIAIVRDHLLAEVTSKESVRSPSTVNRYFAAFSKALNMAVNEWEWLKENPMKRITKPKEARGRDRFLSIDEKHRLIEACHASSNPYLYPIVALALEMGMRFGEIIKLRWKDINFERELIILRETKNGEDRILPLTGQSIEILKELSLANCKGDELIFKSRRHPSTEKPIDIRKSFAKALKLAQIEGFRFHDLRHTAASHLAMNGATQGELMVILGHKTPTMTKRYAHYSQQHIRHIMEKSSKISNLKKDKADE
jgi:integrase